MIEGQTQALICAQNAALRQEITREIAELPQADLRGVLRMIAVWKGAEMTDDLVKRLREEALALHVAGWRDPAGGQDTTISAVLADDAADRIEALAADRENRLADLRIIKAERDRLREALQDGRRLWAIAQDDRVRLLIQLEQCEKRHD